jgi:hypothetical protein
MPIGLPRPWQGECHFVFFYRGHVLTLFPQDACDGHCLRLVFRLLHGLPGLSTHLLHSRPAIPIPASNMAARDVVPAQRP